jgi:hypothetical protein
MPDYNLENRITALEEDNVSIKNRLTTAENSITDTNDNLIQAGTDLTTINNDLNTIKTDLNKSISSYAKDGLVFQLFTDIGDNTSVEFPANVITMSTAMTFEIYTKWTEVPSNINKGRLCEFTNSTDTTTLLAMSLNNTNLEVTVNNTLITNSNTNITIPVNTKHTITIILSDKTYFYLDGVYAGQSDTVFSSNEYFAYFKNRFSIESDRIVNGTNYNVRIYNRALTSDEIVTNHNADVDRYDKIIMPGSAPIVNAYIPISVNCPISSSVTVEAVTE